VLKIILQIAKDDTITKADLSNMGIENLPSEIGLLTHVEELNLANNWLFHE